MKSLVILLFTLFSLQAQDPAQLAELKPLSGRALVDSQKLKAGQLADLQLELTLQEGFFAYEDRFLLTVLEPEEAQVGELFISPIVEFDDSVSKKKKMGLKSTGTIKTQLEIPKGLDSGPQTLKMALTYIACTEKFCLTPRTLDLSLDVVIEGAQKPVLSYASSEYIQEQIAGNLSFALILIFLFGVLTSLTPCVYPLIPITLTVLGANQNRSRFESLAVSMSYVLGIALTYSLLGVIAAQTGQLFGSFISHPLVTLAMSLIFVMMGLSLLGLFEIQAPAFVRNRVANTRSNKGFMGAFVSGLLAGVIASPCVGPVLVGILAYIAQTQNSALGFLLLFTFAMGFGMLFLVLGTFSQLAGRLPRSGAWMNLVKTMLALAMFGLAFYYSLPLIKKYQPETTVTQSGVQWRKFSPEKVALAASEGKPVIIDFYADWCAACVEMDKFTFSEDIIIEESKKFVMLKVDATSPFPELNDWQKTYNVYGLPTMIFIDSQGVVRKDLTLTGFEEAPVFIERMQKVLQPAQQ